MNELHSGNDDTAVAPESAPAGVICGSCGAQAKPGARVCPQCGHSLYRTCFCGWELPASARTCPNCGADWSQSMRAARRSRSRRPRKREALQYALLGAAWAVGGLVVLYLLATLFALAAPHEGSIPVGLPERLVLAGQGIARLVGIAVAAVARNASLILGGILVLLVGALGGLLTYLVRVNGRRRSDRRRRRVRLERRP